MVLFHHLLCNCQIYAFHNQWDKNPVYDVNWFTKLLGVGYDDVPIRKEFRNYLGGDNVVFENVDKMLQNTFHVSSGGYNFDFKPLTSSLTGSSWSIKQ